MSDIFQASIEGDIRAIEDYIKSGGDVNVVGGDLDMPPLFYAAQRGQSQSQAASFLISAGANIHWKWPVTGWTSAHMVAIRGHTDTLKILIDAGARLEEKDGKGRTYAHHAAENGHKDTLNYLIDAGARHLPTRLPCMVGQKL